MNRTHDGPARTSPPGTAPARHLVLTRVFDVPVERVWKALTTSGQVKRWWGATGFTVPVAEMDLRKGGSSLVSMQAPAEMGGGVLYNTWEYTRIVPNERLEFILRFTDRDRRALDPRDLGVPGDVPAEVPHVIALRDLGNTTEMTYAEYSYTTDEAREISRAGLEQVLDKLADVLKRR